MKMINRIDDRCGNVECPNKPGQGPFVLVTIGEGNIVGGHRPFRLFLCAPCATGLDKVLPLKEWDDKAKGRS